MPILLSELLQQIETRQDSATLTLKNAEHVFKTFLVNSVRTQQQFYRKSPLLSEVTLKIEGSDQAIVIEPAALTPYGRKMNIMVDGVEKTILIKLSDNKDTSTINVTIDNKETAISLVVDNATPTVNTVLMVDGVGRTVQINTFRSELPKVELTVDGNQEEILIDTNIAIRPRNAYYLKTELSTLTDDDLLSAIKTHTFHDEIFNAGGMASLRRSVKQYAYDSNAAVPQFIAKANINKVWRENQPGQDGIPMESVEIQEANKIVLGKKPNNNGRYLLTNTKEAITISPFIDGKSLNEFIGTEDHHALLADDRLQLKLYAVEIFKQLHSLHMAGYVHRDVNPFNVMKGEMHGSSGEIHLIDTDFMISMKEANPNFAGKPHYISLHAICNINKTKRVDPYLDIWAAAITTILLLEPNLKMAFEALTEECMRYNLEHNPAGVAQTLNQIDELFTRSLEDSADPFLKEGVGKIFKYKKTTAMNAIEFMLDADSTLMPQVTADPFFATACKNTLLSSNCNKQDILFVAGFLNNKNVKQLREISRIYDDIVAYSQIPGKAKDKFELIRQHLLNGLNYASGKSKSGAYDHVTLMQALAVIDARPAARKPLLRRSSQAQNASNFGHFSSSGSSSVETVVKIDQSLLPDRVNSPIMMRPEPVNDNPGAKQVSDTLPSVESAISQEQQSASGRKLQFKA